MFFDTGATSSGLKTTGFLVVARAMSFGPPNTLVLLCCHVIKISAYYKTICLKTSCMDFKQQKGKVRLFAPVHLNPFRWDGHTCELIDVSPTQAQPDIFKCEGALNSRYLSFGSILARFFKPKSTLKSGFDNYASQETNNMS